MTTSTFAGLAVHWEDDGSFESVDVSFDPFVEITVVYEDGFPLRYSYDGTDPISPFQVTVDDSRILNVTYGGVSPTAEGDADAIKISWKDGGGIHSASALSVSYDTGTLPGGGSSGVDYYLVMDADKDPHLGSLSDWTSFDDAIIGVSKVTGSFGPGRDIGWTDLLSHVETTEDDDVVGSIDDDLFRTGAGDDNVFSSPGNDTMNGGDGTDTLHYKSDPVGVVVNLGKGKATDGYANTDKISNFEAVTGSLLDDTIIGNNKFNVLRGLAGNDTLNGKGGNDAAAYDQDAADGGKSGVIVDLKKGVATDGFGDHDTLIDIEAVLGTRKNDKIRGDNGKNLLSGDKGKDVMAGLKGTDKLLGDDGNDKLDGGKGRDTIDGGDGKDKLLGGADNDKLTGGNHADLFLFQDGFGHDRITDFDAGDDHEKINLKRVSAITDMSDLTTDHMSQVGANVVIDDLDGNTITLLNTDIGDLDAGDFIF